ncbi:long-chain-fatty-acid--CoA ligase [Sporosarcina luteola]|uniref:class I adenylate-forming enzyme family protein n=1 Tax=Sporosarcina luteola TaxID=582850 RepID=UPI00203EC17B|nr:long-chain-fatty-acid--CoA ligase [Sporosarcina luteola]MCM3743182.1 long-chain-fatty-acid--CoA ligase [Sporosarcina luteola]
MNIVEMLEVNTLRHPSKEALIYQNSTYTYEEFNVKVNQLAHGLVKEGVKKGDKIAMFMKNSADFVFTYYAGAKIGAILVPINFRLSPKEINYIMTQSESNFIVADQEYEEIVYEAIKEIPTVSKQFTAPFAINKRYGSLSKLFIDRTENPGIQLNGTDDLHLLYTSGTTGLPKGALFDHDRVEAVALQFILTLNYHSDERMMNFCPLFHCAQLTIGMLSGFYIGATTVVYRDFNPRVILADIKKYRITSFLAVPTMHIAFINTPKDEDINFSSVEKILYGAAPMSVDVVRKCIDYYGTHQMYSLCGQTEGGPNGIVLYPKDHKKHAGMAGKNSSMFTLVDIVNEQGESVEPGVVGELLFKGPTVMKEYYNNPEATAKTIRDGWLHTGDLAMKDQDGYIQLVDRNKDMIISGGENIYSIEVENTIGMHPKVADVAVIGSPDTKWGELVTAIVVKKPNEEVTEQEIIDFTQLNIARFKAPKKVVFVDALPRNASGKLMKYQLREAYTESNTLPMGVER